MAVCPVGSLKFFDDASWDNIGLQDYTVFIAENIFKRKQKGFWSVFLFTIVIIS